MNGDVALRAYDSRTAEVLDLQPFIGRVPPRAEVAYG